MSFHVTTLSCLDSILKEGLRPAIGPRSIELNESVARVYFFPTREAVETALLNWLGDSLEGEDIAILEVACTGLQMYSTCQYEEACEDLVPPTRIVRIEDEDFSPISSASARG